MDKIFTELRQQYLFGLMDGLNGAVGLVIGLLNSSAAASVILVALLSRAFSSSISMAGAQYQSDEVPAGRARRTMAMGVGYLSSAALPGVGFTVSIHAGVAVFIPSAVVILGVIIWVRHEHGGWVKATVTTLTIFVLAVAAGFLASLIG